MPAFRTANPEFSVSYAGFVNQEGPEVLGGTLSFSTTAGESSETGLYPVTPSGLSSDNYTISFVAGELTVTDKLIPQVNWARPAAIVYGAALDASQLNAGADVAGTFSYDPPLGTRLAAGSSHTLRVTFTPDDQGNYIAVPASVQLGVSPAPLTVTADDQSFVAGGEWPALTYRISGFVNGEAAQILTGVALCTSSATAESVPGSYPISCTAGTLWAANYEFSFVDGTLSIDGASETRYAVYLPLMLR